MQFLLERLAQPLSFDGTQQFDVRAAIGAQIQRLVSTRTSRSGTDLDLLEFGCQSVVDLGANSKIQLEQYTRRLTRLIVRYEPRLSTPRVQIEASGQALTPFRVVVSGSIGETDGMEIFHFELPSH